MPADDQLGAKPAGLRCSRCGKFVDWEDAHAQIICTCTPRITLPPVLVREATDDDRRALYFYQRRGYRLTDLVPNSVIEHTQQEVAGFAGIAVRDEIRLEKKL